MVDALVSGASAARRAGSSPVLGTLNKSQLKQNQLVGSFLFKNCTEFAPSISRNIYNLDKKKNNQVEYLVTCIGAFAEKYNLALPQAYSYLKRFTGIDFLIECYDIEHTLSIENAVEDLQQLCYNHGGKIL